MIISTQVMRLAQDKTEITPKPRGGDIFILRLNSDIIILQQHNFIQMCQCKVKMSPVSRFSIGRVLVLVLLVSSELISLKFRYWSLYLMCIDPSNLFSTTTLALAKEILYLSGSI